MRVIFTAWGLLTRPRQEYVNKMVDEITLLSKKEFALLFPDCTIKTEFFLRTPKAYLAIRKTQNR
jgi:hypothetical protein